MQCKALEGKAERSKVKQKQNESKVRLKSSVESQLGGRTIQSTSLRMLWRMSPLGKAE